MKTYRLPIEELEIPFQILAIYTDEQDYRLAFLLNQYLHLHLTKSTSIIHKIKKTDFTAFEYEDAELFHNWLLLSNYCHVNSKKNKTNAFDLFNQKPTDFKQKINYLKAYKKANFLLKITAEEDFNIEKTYQTLEQIPQVYAVELIDLKKIKNKKLLNF